MIYKVDTEVEMELSALAAFVVFLPYFLFLPKENLLYSPALYQKRFKQVIEEHFIAKRKEAAK